jgi:hypothetical protein
MTPGRHDWDVYRADSYSFQYTLWSDEAASVPFDLTDAVSKAEIREKSGGSIIVPLETEIILPNQIIVTLSHTASQSLPASGQWDLQLTWPTGPVRTVIAGNVSVTGDITDSTLAPVMFSRLGVN